MKGHKDSSGKFHPHTEYKKGVRKSRDQSAKTQGVRLQREDPFMDQKMKWKQMLKDHRDGKISGIDVLQYYYSVPMRNLKLYGLPAKAPKLKSSDSYVRKAFSITRTKEVGGIPSYLGGTDSTKVELIGSRGDKEIILKVGDKERKFKDFNEAMKVYHSIDTKEDLERELEVFNSIRKERSKHKHKWIPSVMGFGATCTICGMNRSIEREARDKPNPYVTGKERKDVLKHFWFDKLTPNEQKIVFKDFKKDRIKFGYPPFQGDINEFREHEIYMVSAFGEEDGASALE